MTVTFNKPIDITSLSGHFTLTAQGRALEGGYSTFRGAQVVSFIARAPLPSGDVLVRVDGVAPQTGPGQSCPFRKLDRDVDGGSRRA